MSFKGFDLLSQRNHWSEGNKILILDTKFNFLAAHTLKKKL